MQETFSGIVAANDNDEFRFYVYAWQYPDGRTFYIGKGCGRRDKEESTGRNKIFKRILAKIRRDGGHPRTVRWQEGLREEDAHHLEIAYIKLFGRRDLGTGVLCNLTAGGEGGSNPSEETRVKIGSANRGKTPSAETRAKISAAGLGRKRSAETNAKIAASLTGRTMTEESRALLSAAKLGSKHTPETRAKMSAAQLGRKRSRESIEKSASASRGRIASAETRAKIGAANRGKVMSAESRAKISSAQKGIPKSMEHRAKIGAAQVGKIVSAETSANISAGHRAAKPSSANKFGLKGVRVFSETNKYGAAITISGRRRHLGTFETPEQAAHAYDEAAIEAYGLGNCYINFPEEQIDVANSGAAYSSPRLVTSHFGVEALLLPLRNWA